MKKILILGALGYLAWHSAMGHAAPVVTATASGSVAGDRSITQQLGNVQDAIKQYDLQRWSAPSNPALESAAAGVITSLKDISGKTFRAGAAAEIRVSGLGSGSWSETAEAGIHRTTVARAIVSPFDLQILQTYADGTAMPQGAPADLFSYGESLTVEQSFAGVSFTKDFSGWQVTLTPKVQRVETRTYIHLLSDFSSSAVLSGGLHEETGINLDASLHRYVGGWDVGLSVSNLYPARIRFAGSSMPNRDSKRWMYTLDPQATATAATQHGATGLRLSAELNPSKPFAFSPGHQWLSGSVDEQLPLDLTATAGVAYNIDHSTPDVVGPTLPERRWKGSLGLSGHYDGLQLSASAGAGNGGYRSINFAIRGTL